MLPQFGMTCGPFKEGQVKKEVNYHPADSEAMVGKLEREIEDLNGDLREAYKKMDGYEAELDDLRDELAQRATEGRGRGGALPSTLKHSMSIRFF